MKKKIKIKKTDALIIVDFQNDFCPGRILAVPGGNEIGKVINKIGPLFGKRIIATQDWHPKNHCSFRKNGGSWPVHCLAGTEGADFHSSLNLGLIATIIRKATERDKEAYSGFEGTDWQGNPLVDVLWKQKIERIFICGLATDYCVKATVLDGLKKGFEAFVILDAIRAINVNPGDKEKALNKMKKARAKFVESNSLY